MSNTARLQSIRKSVDQIVNDEHRVDCACLIASGEENANSTIGFDNGESEEWAGLVIRSIECLIESQSSKIQESFKGFGLSW